MKSNDALPSRRVVDAVATIEDVPPTDLEPLHDVIDVEALDSYLTASADDFASLTFSYCGHDVEVDGRGRVFVDGVPFSPQPSDEVDACDRCGEQLESQTWYPVIFTDDEETELRSFCGELCLEAWQSDAEGDRQSTSYELNCLTCDFETTVASSREALEADDTHRTTYGDHHFVELERIENE